MGWSTYPGDEERKAEIASLRAERDALAAALLEAVTVLPLMADYLDKGGPWEVYDPETADIVSDDGSIRRQIDRARAALAKIQ